MCKSECNFDRILSATNLSFLHPVLPRLGRVRAHPLFFDPPARASARIAFDSRRLLRAFVVCVPRPWCGPGKRWPTGPTRAASSPKPSSMCSPEGVAQVVRAA